LWQEAAVPGLILAAVNPDNTPHGYNWTFAFPMLLFIVVASVLYALFSRPHRRVPGRLISSAATAAMPDVDIEPAASSGGGLSVAPGGGTAESVHEPDGALLVADKDPADQDLEASARADSDTADAGAAEPGQTAPGPMEDGE
jgi:hypothetical protein